ncbi:MAG: SpoIIE family protein phosphatase [Leptospiraceae bacterium]|nr:SpoIIE family protein phosphatase [Leptospiraceae bacterium]
MELIDQLFLHTYFNFYSFGTLLVEIFTLLCAAFFLGLPNKSSSTFHLGLAFFFLFLFNTGYLIASSYYAPIAAYHRWLTGGFILPAILHFGQFFFHYPSNTHPKYTKIHLIVSWVVAIIVDAIFFFVTSSSDKKFHFTGHYWDFDAEPISRLLATMIIIYSVINFFLIGGWKAYLTKTKDRKVLFLMMFGMLLAAILPNITNLQSRDGAMERSTYLLTLVSCFVIGFFAISLIYINSTPDKTSFMAKVLSVTIVTILIIMQSLSYFAMKDQDQDYDIMRVHHVDSIIDKGDYFSDVAYKLVLDISKPNSTLNKTEYSDTMNLDLPLIEIDFRNSAVYETIVNMSDTDYRKNLIVYLNSTHESFGGYKRSILQFIKENGTLSDVELRAKVKPYLSKLNKLTYVSSNKISALNVQNFCVEIDKYLNSKNELAPFKEELQKHIKDCKLDGVALDPSSIRREVNKFFRFFDASYTRHYRRSLHPYESQRHFVSYIYYNKYENKVTEIGFNYLSYRNYVHKLAANQQSILVLVVIGIIIFYPLFLRGSLITPLNQLLEGVEKVNKGDLRVEVPVKVHDEIGFLADSFNKMVVSIKEARAELQNYAETLEEKVKARTKEVEEKMTEVEALKNQQDGDYYLTSLLAKPLFMNANKSELVKTEFFIRQKKHFQFRNKEVELGGDICVSGNLRFGNKDFFKRYTFAMNGDAMGKSMQGAGGSLVMGVVINSILARSARNNWVLDSTPEKWLTDVYYEINRIFKSFNGSMVISCIAMLINDETGETHYFNAEHPFCVLYRDGVASFLESTLMLRKLGLDSEIPFQVFKTKLIPGDVMILASDGRDDLDLTPNEPVRTINEDETLFLRNVEKGEGQINGIFQNILNVGHITDDFSIIRIGYRESEFGTIIPDEEDTIKYIDDEDIETVYERSKSLLKDGNQVESYQILGRAYLKDSDNLKVARLYGLLAFKNKDYETSVAVIKKYLVKDPFHSEFWYYLGISQKKLGNYTDAESTAKQLSLMQPNHLANMINLADLERLLGNKDEAIRYASLVLEKDNNNQTAKKLLKLITNEDITEEAEI